MTRPGITEEIPMNDKTGGNRIPRRAAALAVMAAAAVMTTACSSTSSDPLTASSVQGAPVTVTQELALAQCMRGHRVPDFPDPGPSGGFSLSASAMDSSRAQAAYGACRHLLAGGGPSLPRLRREAEQAQRKGQEALPALLKFTQCVRRHGVPDFPEPPVPGQRTPAPPGGGGINPISPQFRAAVSACQHLLPTGIHLSVRTHVSPGTHAP
jgi:hypothetical protein